MDLAGRESRDPPLGPFWLLTSSAFWRDAKTRRMTTALVLSLAAMSFDVCKVSGSAARRTSVWTPVAKRVLTAMRKSYHNLSKSVPVFLHQSELDGVICSLRARRHARSTCGRMLRSWIAFDQGLL